MYSPQSRRQLLLIAGIGFVALITMLIVLSNASAVHPPTPQSIQQIITPTGTLPQCGLSAAKADSKTHDFPVISVTQCSPDPSVLPRKAWLPIVAHQPLSGMVGSAVCEDWYAYHTNETGTWEIYRLGSIPGKPDSNRNLSQGGGEGDSIGPALSPDRRSVAFTTNRDGNWEIYVGATDGLSAPERVTYNSFAVDIDPVWSPDGTSFIYESVRKGNWDLYLFNVASGEETQLTDSPASEIHPGWSPDGKTILYESVAGAKSQINSLDVASHKVTALSDGTGSDYDPIYSPDGKQIVFRSMSANSKNGVVYIMNADGSKRTVISDLSGSAANQSWSPDGSLIVYQSRIGGNLGIYVYQLSSGKTRQVTDNSASNYAPTWDCKSQTLVFTSNVNGTPNLFRTPALPIGAPPVEVGTQAERLTQGSAASQYPVGSPLVEDASKQGMTPEPEST